jgi:hypothetical protein
MNDLRTDARDDHEEYTGQVLQARRAAKAARIEAKARRKAWRQRRDALMLKAREARSALRLLRYRVAMFAHRVLGKGTPP